MATPPPSTTPPTPTPIRVVDTRACAATETELWQPRSWQGPLAFNREAESVDDLLQWLRHAHRDRRYRLEDAWPGGDWDTLTELVHNTWSLVRHVADRQGVSDYPPRPFPDRQLYSELTGGPPATYTFDGVLGALDGLDRWCKLHLRPSPQPPAISPAAATSQPVQPSPAAPPGPGAAGTGSFSPAELAAEYGVDAEALRKRLERFRKQSHIGWIEVANRGHREPRFRYKPEAIMHIVRKLQASARMSG